MYGTRLKTRDGLPIRFRSDLRIPDPACRDKTVDTWVFSTAAIAGQKKTNEQYIESNYSNNPLGNPFPPSPQFSIHILSLSTHSFRFSCISELSYHRIPDLGKK